MQSSANRVLPNDIGRFVALKARFELLIPCIIGIAAFLLISGGRILNPSRIDWLTSGDPAQHFLGWQFFRNTPAWQSPMGANPAFGMEIGSSIVYTDSLPLLAFLFKSIRRILPDVFQYMGIWMLLCFVLQAVLAWKLIAKFSDSAWIKTFGAGFFVLAPPFLLRMHGHESLMGHWLILAALLLYFSKSWFPGRWLTLLVIASLVHAYLLFMVAAVLAADRLTRLLARTVTLRAVTLSGIVSLGALLLVMWQAGYFVLPGDAVQGGGYGYYRMNLASLFHANGGWSVLMASYQLGPGDDEGFNFLGTGGLILVLLAIGESLRDVSVWSALRRIWPLAAVAFLLTLYAVSNHVAFGSTELLVVPLPEPLSRLTSVFRASGRLFWPVFYLIYLGAMFVLAARYRGSVASALLGCLLLLQIADSWEALGILHRKLHDRQPWTSSLQSPFWTAAAGKYRRILYIPPHNVPRNYFDLSYYAAANHQSINIGAFARVNGQEQGRIAGELTRSISDGRFAEDALYIFEQGATWNAAISHLRPDDRGGVLDGFRVIAPNWGQCRSCGDADPFLRGGAIKRMLTYRLDSQIDFRQGGNSQEYTLDGFSAPEPWGTWTDGNVAHIGFTLDEDPKSDLTLAMASYAYVSEKHPVQQVQVFVNGQSVGEFTYGKAGGIETHQVRIPQAAFSARSGDVVIELRLPKAISPSEVGEYVDGRRLALGLVSATLGN